MRSQFFIADRHVTAGVWRFPESPPFLPASATARRPNKHASRARRNLELPDVRTLSEQGFDISKLPNNWFGIFAPKGIPQAIVVKMSEQIQSVIEAP